MNRCLGCGERGPYTIIRQPDYLEARCTNCGVGHDIGWDTSGYEEVTVPPEGWFPFGYHARLSPVPDLEFSEETDPEDGLPLWERVADNLILDHQPVISAKRISDEH